MTVRHTRFDSMTFPPYEFQEFPKMVMLPRKLPSVMPKPDGLSDGDRHIDGNGYLIAVIKDGKWEAVPEEFAVKNAQEEAEVRARFETKKPLTASLEKDELLKKCVALNIQHDKRWGIDRLKEIIEAAEKVAA